LDPTAHDVAFDPYVIPAEFYQRAADQIPDAELIVLPPGDVAVFGLGVDASSRSMFCHLRREQKWNRGDAPAGFEWGQRCVDAARADGDPVMIALGSRGVAEADATGNPSIRSVTRWYTYSFMDAAGRGTARPLMETSYEEAMESNTRWRCSARSCPSARH
jgi:hypothetical protein